MLIITIVRRVGKVGIVLRSYLILHNHNVKIVNISIFQTETRVGVVVGADQWKKQQVSRLMTSRIKNFTI